MNNHLLFFYGTDCPHCDAMRPLLAKLTFDTGTTVDERNVWDSESDFRLMKNYQEPILKNDPECDGLPFLYNTKTGGHLCGEVSYQKLKEWAILTV